MFARIVATMITLTFVARLVGGGVCLADPNWGNLTGTFVFDGVAPPPKALVVNKDQEFCGRFGAVDESLIVNKRNGGIKNIVVYLYSKPDGPQPKVHPGYAKTATSEVVFDNIRCRFVPHVVLLRTTQTLLLKNSDAVGHNAKIETRANSAANPLIRAGSVLKRKFDAPERLPCRASCNLHPWMTAWVVIKDHPYVAVTDENGRFSINGLPVGEWTFQFWHEQQGYIQKVKMNGATVDWQSGRTAIQIAPGTKDLGTIATRIEGE